MPLRIVIDVRRIRDFGIGTYIRNLVHGLASLDRENHYVLVAPRPDEPELGGLPPNFEIAVYARSDTDWVNQFAFHFFLKQLRAEPDPHPAQRGAPADAPALRGHHPRHEQPAVRASAGRCAATSDCTSSAAGWCAPSA